MLSDIEKNRMYYYMEFTLDSKIDMLRKEEYFEEYLKKQELQQASQQPQSSQLIVGIPESGVVPGNGWNNYTLNVNGILSTDPGSVLVSLYTVSVSDEFEIYMNGINMTSNINVPSTFGYYTSTLNYINDGIINIDIKGNSVAANFELNVDLFCGPYSFSGPLSDLSNNNLDCTFCPEGRKVFGPATAGSYCVCEEGTVEINGECQPCPNGANCRGDGGYPITASGFYSEFNVLNHSNSQDQIFFRCFVESSCAGGVDGTLCSDGYQGFLCNKCIAGKSQVDGYCLDCWSSAFGLPDWLPLAGGSVILIIFFLFFLRFSRLYNKVGAIPILLNYLQILAILGGTRLAFPSTVRTALLYMTAFNLNTDLFFPECWSIIPYYFTDWFSRWILQMSIPIFVLVLYFAIKLFSNIYNRLARNHLWKEVDWVTVSARLWNAFVSFILFSYIFIAKGALTVFDCIPRTGNTWPLLQDEGYFLDIDADISCSFNNSNWIIASITSIFYLGSVTIFLPVLMILLIRKHKKELRDTIVSNKWGSMYMRYDEKHPYWEIIIMVRKFLIVSSVLFLSWSESVQTLAIVTILVISLCLQLRYRPFNHWYNNQLETWTIIILLLFVMGSLSLPADSGISEYYYEIGVLSLLTIGLALGLLWSILDTIWSWKRLWEFRESHMSPEQKKWVEDSREDIRQYKEDKRKAKKERREAKEKEAQEKKAILEEQKKKKAEQDKLYKSEKKKLEKEEAQKAKEEEKKAKEEEKKQKEIERKRKAEEERIEKEKQKKKKAEDEKQKKAEEKEKKKKAEDAKRKKDLDTKRKLEENKTKTTVVVEEKVVEKKERNDSSSTYSRDKAYNDTISSHALNQVGDDLRLAFEENPSRRNSMKSLNSVRTTKSNKASPLGFPKVPPRSNPIDDEPLIDGTEEPYTPEGYEDYDPESEEFS